jgi:hypothetical protein
MVLEVYHAFSLNKEPAAWDARVVKTGSRKEPSFHDAAGDRSAWRDDASFSAAAFPASGEDPNPFNARVYW